MQHATPDISNTRRVKAFNLKDVFCGGQYISISPTLAAHTAIDI